MEERDLNVYGHNQPDEKCEVKQGIREQSVGHVAQASAAIEIKRPSRRVPRTENPRPPLHAPFSDEEPS
jgi:hypothetical protein